jgi:hypothetical protein
MGRVSVRLVRLAQQPSRVAEDVRAALASLGRGSTVVGGVALIGARPFGADRVLEAVVILPQGVLIVIGVDLPDPAMLLEAPLDGPWKADGWPLVHGDEQVNPATEALELSRECARRIGSVAPGTGPVGTIVAVGPYVDAVDQPPADLAGMVRVLYPTPTTMLAATVSLATAPKPRSVEQARALISVLAPDAPPMADELLLGEGFSAFSDDEPTITHENPLAGTTPTIPADHPVKPPSRARGGSVKAVRPPVEAPPAVPDPDPVVPDAAAPDSTVPGSTVPGSTVPAPVVSVPAAAAGETAPAGLPSSPAFPALAPQTASNRTSSPQSPGFPSPSLPSRTSPDQASAGARSAMTQAPGRTSATQAPSSPAPPAQGSAGAPSRTSADQATSSSTPPARTAVGQAPSGPDAPARSTSSGPPRGPAGPAASAGSSPVPRRSRTVRWLPLAAIGLLVVLLVAAVSIAAGGDDTAAPPSTTPPTPVSSAPPTSTSRPVENIQFTSRAAAADQRCASHGFGDVQASLQRTSCSGVKRASFAATIDGRDAAVSVGIVEFATAEQANAFKAVADTPGGGGILDLATETGQWDSGVPRFDGAAYESSLEGRSVRLVQAVWLPGPSTSDDPGLTRAAKAALTLPVNV